MIVDAERIISRMKFALGIKTQRELGLQLGVSESSISKWIKTNDIPEKHLVSVCLKAGINLEYFLSDNVDNDFTHLTPGSPLPRIAERPEGAFWSPPDLEAPKIPIIGQCSAGIGQFFDDMGYPVGEADEWEVRPYDLKDVSAYGLRICDFDGDSMMPAFRPKDVVIASDPVKFLRNMS